MVAVKCRYEVVVLAGLELEPIGLGRERAERYRYGRPAWLARLLITNGHRPRRLTGSIQAARVVLVLGHLFLFVF